MVSEPFTTLPAHVLSLAARRAIQDLVLGCPHLLREHLDTRTRRGTALWYCPSKLVEACAPAEFARLRAACPLPFAVDLIYLPPGAQVARHVDGAKHIRSTVIATPLWPPAPDYGPTLYWADMQAQEPTHRVPWGDLPVLLDIQRPHSVSNPARVPRFNVQLTFGQPFAELAHLLQSGALAGMFTQEAHR